jgi:hypothetical protein
VEYKAAGVGGDDIVFVAFGFGPFIGFWSGYEGAKRIDWHNSSIFRTDILS